MSGIIANKQKMFLPIRAEEPAEVQVSEVRRSIRLGAPKPTHDGKYRTDNPAACPLV
jgi:hypothetical protein